MTLCFECSDRTACCRIDDARTYTDEDGAEREQDFAAYLCRACFDRFFPERRKATSKGFVDGGKQPPTTKEPAEKEKPSGGFFAGW